MKRIFFTSIFFFAFIHLYSQAVYNKVGGVAFRIDDHQLPYKWHDFDSIFNKYGYKFSLGLDAQRIVPDVPAYNELHNVAAHGHEFMDHTAYGTTAYSWVHTLKDTMYFYGKKGVDHIATNRICFKVDSVFTGTDTNEGTLNLYGNTVISTKNGEFSNIYGNPYFSNFYFPSKKMVVTWYNLQNKNSNDPDTAQFRSYWQETITLDTVLNMPYHKITGYDIKMNSDAIKLMIERSLYLYDSLQLPRPRTWIQPGGQFAQFNQTEVKKYMADMYGYNAAATYVQTSLKMYNEVDSMKTKRFAVQNPDFSEESNSFQAMIKTISDNSARHLHSFALSHFLVQTNVWSAYLSRVDSLLAWCRDNNIPVRTINQWASIMFDSIPNPFANAIPEFYKDLNKDGTPDGLAAPFGNFDTTDGVARSKGISISRTNSGSFFAINLLGGFEKGWNRLSAYTKGKPGDSIRVAISLNEIPFSAKYYNLAANTDNWQEVSTMVYIDPRASRMTFQINALRNSNVGEIKLSGAQLRKNSSIKIKSGVTFSVRADENFPTIFANQFVIDSFYTINEYQARITTANKLQVMYDSISRSITIKKPGLLWVGKDSLKVFAMNPDKTIDSGWIYFESINPRVCKGSSIKLKVDKTAGTNFKWTDPNFVYFGDTLLVSPTQTTLYNFQYLGNDNKDYYEQVTIEVDKVKPNINFPTDTIVCLGSTPVFSIADSGKIEWLNTFSNQVTKGNTLIIPAINLDQQYSISNALGSCKAVSTLNVKVNPLKLITKKNFNINLIKGNSGTVDIGVSANAYGILLNAPYNKFTYTNGTVLFDPKTNFTGKDTAIYLITDKHCAFDTIKVLVNVSVNGVNEIGNENKIIVYPNPASQQITIESSIKGNLEWLDISGRVISRMKVEMPRQELNLQDIPSGVYILHFSSGELNTYLRFIKE